VKRTPIRTASGHVFLDVKQHFASARISADLLKTMENAELQHTLDRATGDLLVKLVARIPGKVFDSKEHYYPSDWVQAFKERWLKSRLSKRVFGPVRYTLISMTAEASYPSIRVPNHNPFVQVTMKKNES
jgi:hypothetical protein